ncbi:MAG: septum site-determining protein MinC [Proteobacteria bacterium]|nr:septum site-determining protein MinC [Desulfobacula sp.]MBU3951852.1 septum site-determining protein MinC [Pseudomonadota bacterium]MBU4132622.1 septum site-determining protein MinC [Pseudomonadota bacterium]
MINFESVRSVRLKGVGKGFWITLDPSFPEAVLISEIDKLIRKLKHLAVNADVVLDVGDAKGHEDLILRMKTYLRENFDLGLISTTPVKRSVPTERIRQRDLSKGWNHHRSEVLMLRGRVRSGQKIDAKKHLVITGDVNPGAEIVAGGDVIVLGRLSGKVHAGFPDKNDAMVFALEFNPSHVKIGSVAASGNEEGASSIPEFASVENSTIVVKDYMKASPFRRMPWPEAI